MDTSGTHCVEIAQFKLRPGVSDTRLLELEARIRRGAISAQAGFISRELCKDEDANEWLLVLRFTTRETLQAWLAIVKTVPEMRAMAALLDLDRMKVRNYTHHEIAS